MSENYYIMHKYFRAPNVLTRWYLVDHRLTMNQISLATIVVVAVLAAFATPLIALAQNMSGGTPEKSKLPAGNMTGNATNTTGTEGIFPTPTLTPSG